MYSLLILLLSIFAHLSNGLYLKPIAANPTLNNMESNEQPLINQDIWNSVQHQLGLTHKKVEILKSQKDQKGTMDLLKRFIRDNPKYAMPLKKKNSIAESNPTDFTATYHGVLDQLRNIRGTLKTSLNFEISDLSQQKELKRPRRKIAVRMVSDMPTDKINDLLAVFNEKYGLDESKLPANDYDEYEDDEEKVDFDMIGSSATMPFVSDPDPDYMYEHLYEDEKDPGVPAKSNGNMDFNSFQHLIMQASHNQWEREQEETKLHTTKNPHFDE